MCKILAIIGLSFIFYGCKKKVGKQASAECVVETPPGENGEFHSMTMARVFKKNDHATLCKYIV